MIDRRRLLLLSTYLSEHILLLGQLYAKNEHDQNDEQQHAYDAHEPEQPTGVEGLIDCEQVIAAEQLNACAFPGRVLKINL